MPPLQIATFQMPTPKSKLTYKPSYYLQIRTTNPFPKAQNHAKLGSANIYLNNFQLYLMSITKVIKSISDKRIYRPLSLHNNIQCLIISDKDAQKSAAALSVGVGSFSDPLQAQGLAHYLEHMLFMGTVKYPEENEYSNFLSKNAGSSNAYTSLEQTNFYFEVSHGAFVDALDRFSRFFIDPLMLDSSSERELNAVHSEHSKNLQNDSWKKYQLSKHLAKTGHPYNKFSTGNKQSLGCPNLREMLFKFYNNSYSSNLMKLVVYGQMDIDTLTKEVEQKFAEVKDSAFNGFKIKQAPFDEKTYGKLIKVVPVKDRRVLQLVWILPNQMEHYKTPPSKYVSHLLGHEGKGSLLSFLIAKGLATSLSAGGSDSYSCFSEFEVTITLTDKGVDSIRQIIGYVLHYLKMLKESTPQEWVVKEIQRVNKMKFDFLNKSQGMNYCSGLAKNLHKRKIDQVLIFPYLMQEFRPDLINAYLDNLRFDNLISYVEAKKFQSECTLEEPIYKTKYGIQPLGEIVPIACDVSLPEHNLFIPDDLSLLPLGTKLHPRKLYQSQFIEAFFKQDHQFELPKAQIDLRVYFDGVSSVRQDVIKTLFEKMLKEQLREFTYLADMAQLQSQFSFSSYYTLNLKITGFRDSFDRFINRYLKEILDFVPTNLQLFETLKEKQKKEYSNYFLNNPYQIAYNAITYALREGSSTSPSQKLKEIDSVTLEHLVAYAKKWNKKLYLEYYITGNLVEDHATRIAKQIEKFVSERATALSKSLIGTIRPIFLPLAKTCAVEEVLKSGEESNNSLIVHYQHEALSLRSKILQELASSFVKEPAFDYLRTKQQLGYIVMCLADDHRGVLGLSILVQSNIKNTYELQQYVNKFVNEILKEKLTALNEATFLQYRTSLQNTKRQKDKNLSSEAARFWGEIVKHSYQFQRKEKEIEDIQKITLQDFKKFISSIFYDSPRVFQIHQIAQPSLQKTAELRNQRKASDPNFQLFSDIQTFRKKMPLYPDYYSHL